MTHVHYHVEDRIGYITLNRPEKRNALSFELVTDLKEAFAVVEQDEQVKVVVLAANGEAFCAGADLSYLQKLQHFSPEENLADSNHLKELFYKIYTLKKPVIAQVQGHALAGGCGLATVCDVVFAIPGAKFGYTEVKIGFIPALVMVFLLRRIGEGHARQLLLSGELLSAHEAHRMGLVNTVVDAENLVESVRTYARRLADSNSGHAMMLTKTMMATVQSTRLEDALEFAASKNVEARASDDCKRGIAAFLSKEKITW